MKAISLVVKITSKLRLLRTHPLISFFLFLVLHFLSEPPPRTAMLEVKIYVQLLVRVDALQFLDTLQELPFTRIEVDIHENGNVADALSEQDAWRTICASKWKCFGWISANIIAW